MMQEKLFIGIEDNLKNAVETYNKGINEKENFSGNHSVNTFDIIAVHHQKFMIQKLYENKEEHKAILAVYEINQVPASQKQEIKHQEQWTIKTFRHSGSF